MRPDIVVASYNDVTCVVWPGPGILNFHMEKGKDWKTGKVLTVFSQVYKDHRQGLIGLC